MKAKKLYVCGTAWSFERDTTNGGELEFYTTAKALKADRRCWKECGIAEIDPVFVKYVSKPKPISKRQRVSGKTLEAEQALYIPLAEKLVALSLTVRDNELAESALTWALATLKNKRKKRERRKK